MKKLGITALLLTVLIVMLSVAGCNNSDNNSYSDNNGENNATEGVGKTTSYLFVQNATSGTFVSNGDETYTLTINGVSPQTIYFSDRPERKAGQVEMQKFLDLMCFNSINPPNAAIDILNVGEENDVVVVELINPVYDSDAATLQYTARILEDANHSIADFNERNDGSIPESFDGVALFIDACSNVTMECWNGPDLEKDHEAGYVSCCRCFHWGCGFQLDCCSFSRCQNQCTAKYGDSYYYLHEAGT